MNIRRTVNRSQYLMYICMFLVIGALFVASYLIRYAFDMQVRITTISNNVNTVLNLKSALLFDRNYNVLNTANTHFIHLDEELEQLGQQIQLLSIKNNNLIEFKRLTKEFRKKFDQLIQLQFEYGLTENEGLRGKFRAAVHAMQKVFTAAAAPKLELLVLELRRREKDFLLRGLPTYLEVHDNLVTKLKSEMIAADFNNQKTTYLLALLDEYQINFKLITNNIQNQGVHSGLGIRGELTQLEHQLNNLKKALATDISADLRHLFLLFLGAIALIIITLISLSSFWLMAVNRKIYKSIEQISQTMHKITTQSNFSLRFTHDDNDEFNTMCNELNELLSHFERVLKNLEDAQHRLIQSEKLASLVDMVSGVAHELNTPLGVSITSGSIIKEQIQEIKQAFETQNLSKRKLQKMIKTSEQSLALLENNLERTGQLVTQFKEITAYQNYSEKLDFCLFTVVESVVFALNQEISKVDAVIELDIPKPWIFTSYSGAFAQISQLLIVNALRHAVLPDRQLTIKIKASLSTDYDLTLTFEDNGKGVLAQNIDKIFEPFYTTARKNGGTGLGLSVVFNLVDQKLNGKVVAKTNRPSGLIIEITIPNMRLGNLQ